ncbi:hypothetical protein EAX61_06565 [Dokdonia sinensis]|uniref:Lipoprotein n=1 Tax=Dokdonia sinensis TaxID=2479847 RepID=A0A3M0G612_9FLAO|nr:hypothetical protein [Dokdonia sinensis]RMB60480.1 hypothetical protein EAX61_06565 [Dokdonia sinensis]
MKKFLVAFSLFLVFGCNSDETDDFGCSSRLSCVGGEITLQFIDVETGEDYILANDIELEDVMVTGENGSTENIEFNIVRIDGTNDVKLFLYGYTGNENGDFLYEIRLENDFDFTLTFNQKVADTGGCCPGFETTNVNFDTVEVQVVENSDNRSFRVLL